MTDNEVKWLIVGKLLRRNLMAVKDEQWEVLIDTMPVTVTRRESDGMLYNWPYPFGDAGKALTYADFYTADGMELISELRLTVNGVSAVLPLVYAYNNYNAGNMGLGYPDESDDGFDYWVSFAPSPNSYSCVCGFGARQEGTYTVKIERKVS